MEKRGKIIVFIILLIIFGYKGLFYVKHLMHRLPNIPYKQVKLDINQTEGNTIFGDISIDLEYTDEDIIQLEDSLVVFENENQRVTIFKDEYDNAMKQLIQYEPTIEKYFRKYDIKNDIDMILHYYRSNTAKYNFLTSTSKLKEAVLYNKYITPGCDGVLIFCDLVLLDGYIVGELRIRDNGFSVRFVHIKNHYTIIFEKQNFTDEEVIDIVKSIKLN